MLAALRDVGVTVIVPTGSRTDVTPYTADSVGIEINLIRHRLDAKNFFAVNRWRRRQLAPGPVIFQTLP